MAANPIAPEADQYTLPVPQGAATGQQPVQPVPAPVSQSPSGITSLSAGQPASAPGQPIDAAWTERTNQIMTTYIDDPYRLNKEFSLLKAEYIKRTYGKTLKINEEQSV